MAPSPSTTAIPDYGSPLFFKTGPIADLKSISNLSMSPLPPAQRKNQCLHLRVYKADLPMQGDGAEAFVDECDSEMDGTLKTILSHVKGVKNVVIKRSHRDDGFAFDPNSYRVEIECASQSSVSTIRRPVLERLAEAGFDYSRLPDFSEKAPNRESPSKLDDALFYPISIDIDPSVTVCQPIAKASPKCCRTRLRVRAICCTSEIPAVRSVLKPLPGVQKLGISVATKMVFVDHDPTTISAASMAKALNDQKFGAEIITDGGIELANANDFSALDNIMDLPRSTFVQSTFIIPGMIFMRNTDMKSCPIGEVLRRNFIESHLRAFRVHSPSQSLKVEHDPTLLSAEKIMGALVKELQGGDWGQISISHDGATEELFLPEISAEKQDMEEDLLDEGNIFQGLKCNVVISGILWILSLLSLVGGSLTCLKYAGIGSVLFGMPPVVMKACATIRRMQFDANCMMAIAAFGALALGEFEEAASVAFIFAVSAWLEARATHKGRRALGEIISLRPEHAIVKNSKTGATAIVPATSIPVGTIVSVRTGDKVPADGVVIEGTSFVDESSLTGEARPVEKRCGDDVSSGSINVGNAQLVVRTTNTVGDSTLSRLIQLVEEAQANTSQTEKLVDAFARRYTPVVLGIALLICTIPWYFGKEAGRYWMLNGLIFVVISCPCSVQISTPVTYSAGLAAAAQHGIIIKGGSKLEALGNVKTVLFDKTGTLTTGKFSLNHLESIGNTKSRTELLELLAIMEAPSSHPLSACLVSAAKAEGVVVPSNVSLSDFRSLKGEGIMANLDNRTIYVGNERLFKRLDMFGEVPSQHMESANSWSEEGGTVGYIGIAGLGIIGMFCMKDTVRDNAGDVITSLCHSGIKVVMLSGDCEGATRAVGREIGIEEPDIESQLLPEDKLHYVSELKGEQAHSHSLLSGKRKLILMVGDGVNDAAALAAADIGVAMGEGASLAMEMSDVTLIDSNLSKLLFSMKMGEKVIRTVKENIAFSLVINLIAIVLTIMGKMTLLWAIVFDVGVLLLVTLNGMKLLSKRTIEAIEEKRPKRQATKKESDKGYEQAPDTDSEIV